MDIMNNRQVTRVSRYLSLILRHKPEVAGIELDKHGWAKTVDIIKALKISMDELEFIVNTDSKGRYSFNDNKSAIRANQGHSLKNVDVELSELTPPDILYHGTASKDLHSILSTGLNKQTRQYVHLSLDIDTARAVGKRHGSPVILKVDAKAMSIDGYKFYRSKNNVWMTEHVPVKYLTLV